MATIRICNDNDRELGTVNEDPATRQKEMDITEKWLGEIGGWQAMKAARMIVAAGKVQVTERSHDLVRGHVGGEKSRLSSGLRIRSKSDVENLCTCMMARRTGQICDHALAVALASLLPNEPSAFSQTQPSAPIPRTQGVAPLEPIQAPGQLSLFLPEVLFQSGSGTAKPATAFLKLDPGEGETTKLAAWLRSRGAPLQNTPLSLPAGELGSLLEAAADHPRVYVGKPGAGMHRYLSVSSLVIRPLLTMEWSTNKATSGDEVTFRIAESPTPQLLKLGGSQEMGWLHHPGSATIHPWNARKGGEVGALTGELLLEFRPGKVVTRPLKWLVVHLAELEEIFQVELRESLINRYKVVPVASQLCIEVHGSLQAVRLRVLARFKQFEWKITSNRDDFPVEDESEKGLFYVRNGKNEKSLFNRLTDTGFELSASTGDFELNDKRSIMQFFASELLKLEANYSVTYSDSWLAATKNLLRIAPTVTGDGESRHGNSTGSSGMDWLQMTFAYGASNGFQLSRSDTLRLIRSGQNTVKGKDGRQYVLDVERCEEFEEALQDVPVQMTPDGMRISAAHQNYFLPFASRAALAKTRDEQANLDEWRRRLGTLGGVLRSYQLEGVAWLAQRMEAGQGALLGDDMGLGKTLQSIALIRWVLRQNADSKEKVLVVCPKSLIPNWMAEFERFAPELQVLAVQGSKRHESLKSIDGYDVLITSYPLISRDLAHYQTLKFELGIFDEASFLRNPDTETAAAARSLNLRTRLALSGTPVENGVRDLWSIFQILLPGYLGNRQSFSERFEKPLQSPGDAAIATANRLRRLIRPFFLRRTKSEVLKELPEKIEQVFWCEMSSAQGEIYRRLLEEGREEIRNARRRSGQNGARMTMLTVLLRLRQVCCDVRLAGLPQEKVAHLDLSERSGKWGALDERLDEALADGGKVLVFSQFVAYLKALREHLDGRQIGYAYLDGSTQDRGAEVQSFQTDPQKRVFLISLKAGGYGLNLTQADQVFLMDPWWNPAVEAQAIDRAHRFGQGRVVNAYRFVMRGTVEERVLALQEKKRGLISATIEERAPMMEGLSDSDLESLLEG
jgi:superfamily II DNA or RNA helicase